jgi:hypothetical protein
MSGKSAVPRPGQAPGKPAVRKQGMFNIGKVENEPVKIPAPQINGPGVKEYSTKESIPKYINNEESVQHATMLGNGNQMTGPINTKFCILILILSVVLLSALTIVVLVVGRHPNHSNMRPGGLGQAGFVASGANEMIFDITPDGTRRRDLLTYYYDLVLGDDVQQWQTFPEHDLPLPNVNSSLHKISSYDVCCFSDKEEWICSTGHTFDAYAFEARLKRVTESIGGVQCLIYINSRHMARSQCTVEIRMRS